VEASLAKGAQPSLKYEIIGRNFNEAEKSERCSIVKLSESDNSGIWGRSPQLPEANGDLGAEPPTLWRFFHFFSKNKAFLSILWS